MIRRTHSVVLLAAGLLLGLAAPAYADPSPSASPQISPCCQTQNYVVTGTITGASGAPVAGTTVDLYADPNPAVLAGLTTPGDTIPQDLIGRTTTNTQGSYSIPVGNTAALQADADGSGIVNLSVETYGPGGSAEFTFPRQLATMPDGSLGLAVADPDSNSGVIDVTPQHADMTTDATVPDRPPCGVKTLVENLGKKWTTVGAGFTEITQTQISNTYGKGQESSLGVAVESSGGQFTAGGTADKSSSASQSFGPPVASSTYFRTLFSYGLYNIVCQHNRAEPQYWDTGSVKTDASGGNFTPNTGNCVHEDPGSTLKTSTTSQVEFNAGVSISGDLGGLNLSAQTGWSTNDVLVMTAPAAVYRPNGVRLCGASGVPGHGPKKLEFIAPPS